MGTHYASKTYKCHSCHDAQTHITGCQGHVITIEHQRTSDVTHILNDGEPIDFMSNAALMAMLDLVHSIGLSLVWLARYEPTDEGVTFGQPNADQDGETRI